MAQATADKITHADRLKALFAGFEAWGLMDALLRLRAGDMLVTDPDIAEALQQQIRPLACSVTTPDTYAALLPGDYSRIFFLNRRGEYRMTRKARSIWPALKAFSCTYDLAPAGFPDDLSALAVGENIALSVPAAEASIPFIFTGLQGSDIVYLLKLMESVGLQVPTCSITPDLARWVSVQFDFQLLRYLSQMRKFQGKDAFAMMIESPALLALEKAVGLRPYHVRKLIRRASAKIVYFSHRDKCLRVSVMMALQGTGAASLWELPRARVRSLSAVYAPAEQLFALVRKLAKEEAELEKFMVGLSSLRMITAEELAYAPFSVLEMLAVFMESKMTGDVSGPDYRGRYLDIKGLYDQVDELRGAILKMLALERNALGSLVSPTQVLLPLNRETSKDN